MSRKPRPFTCMRRPITNGSKRCSGSLATPDRSNSMSIKALALQTDGNEFNFRTIAMIPEENFFSLDRLAGIKSYPDSPVEKEVFYRESELFVRYLVLNHGAEKFYRFLARSAYGASP